MSNIRVGDYLSDTIKYHHKKHNIIKMMNDSAGRIIKILDEAISQDMSYENKRVYGISVKNVNECDFEFRAFGLIKTITYAEYESTYLYSIKNINEPANLEKILSIEQEDVDSIMEKLIYKHFGPTSVQGRRAEDFKMKST